MKTISQLLIILIAHPLLDAQLLGQSDNFDDKNDAGWIRYSPLTPFGAGATFAFPNGGYSIIAPATPSAELLGPQRAGSLLGNPDATRTRVEAHVTQWNQEINQAFGLLARVGTVGLATTKGYSYNYNTRSGFHQLNLIVDESPVRAINESPYRLNPAATYKMVFTTVESFLLGQVFATTNLTVPIHSVVGVDETHSTGNAGVFAFSLEATTGVGAFFDDYHRTVPTKVRATFLDSAPAVGEILTNTVDSLTIRLANLETKIQDESVVLEIDGKMVPVSIDGTELIRFVTHTPSTPFSPDKSYSARLRFTDSDGTQTIDWNFGVPVPPQISTILEYTDKLGTPFVADSNASFDSTNSIFTTALPQSSTRFYRINDRTSRTIAGIQVRDGTLLIRFTP